VAICDALETRSVAERLVETGRRRELNTLALAGTLPTELGTLTALTKL
jgi:hypothetical protein